MLRTIIFNIEELILRGLSEKWLEPSFMIMSIITINDKWGHLEIDLLHLVRVIFLCGIKIFTR